MVLRLEGSCVSLDVSARTSRAFQTSLETGSINASSSPTALQVLMDKRGLKTEVYFTAVCVLQPVNAWLNLGSPLPGSEIAQVSIPILQCQPGNGGVAASFGGKQMLLHSNVAMAPTAENCASRPDAFGHVGMVVNRAESSTPLEQAEPSIRRYRSKCHTRSSSYF